MLILTVNEMGVDCTQVNKDLIYLSSILTFKNVGLEAQEFYIK